MDVGNPSNFVRILEIFGHDFVNLKEKLEAVSISDETTAATMREVYDTYRYMLDPHGAVGYRALADTGPERDFSRDGPPGKIRFGRGDPGVEVEAPEDLSDLFERERKY